jgi:hypothetical protein
MPQQNELGVEETGCVRREGQLHVQRAIDLPDKHRGTGVSSHQGHSAILRYIRVLRGLRQEAPNHISPDILPAGSLRRLPFSVRIRHSNHSLEYFF